MILFGYGKTTKAIAEKFGGCKVYDDKFFAYSSDKYGNEFFPSEDFKGGGDEICVTSPGIPPSHPLIKKATNLLSEYDLFADSMPFSIWISGTNGKTTTTAMVERLLKERGAISGGNIGTPLANMSSKAKIWILETSSFTLHYTNRASPNLYLLLPITPDHISWHGSMREYEEAKLKPLRNMREGEVAIIPKKYEEYPTKAMKILYESSEDLIEYFGFDREKIGFGEPFLLDSLMALSTQKILFDEVDYEKINSFSIGSHRVEEFRDDRGRVWINDSKATNPDATIAALSSFKDKKIYLILGGDDKGADLKELFNYLKDLDVEIFAIGKNAKKLEKLSTSVNKSVKVSETLDIAVKQIDKLHTKSSVAILSPAAASLDQFSSYAKRGDDFKEFVKNLS
jgi:UDP-N-acetylmuramoylalanine--D-glutamate ligase